MKKFFVFLTVITICLVFPLFSSAASTNIKNISDYYIDVVFNKDRTCDYTETITVNFKSEGHGIFRTIPVSNESKIYNVSVENERADLYYQNGYVAIRIGDPETTVSGTKTYIIRYTLTTSEIDGKPDIAYLNLIGTDWEADILKANITLTLPEPSEAVDAYVGTYGTNTGRNMLDISQNENIITIINKDTIKAYEGITVMAGQPEGTFHEPVPSYELLMSGVSIVFLLFIIVMFFVFGKDKKLTSVVEFYPPESLNPTETGYLIDQMVDRNDITALIYYWASHDHLHIIEEGKGKFQFIKLSDLDDMHKNYEKSAFDKLFSYGSDGKVSLNDLASKYYTTAGMVKNQVVDSFSGKKKLVDKGAAVFSAFITALLFFILGIMCAARIGTVSVMIIVLSAAAAFSCIIPIGYMWHISNNIYKFNRSTLFVNAFIYILISFIICIVLAFIGSIAALNFYWLLLPLIIGIIAATIVPFITRRTDYYNKILEKVIGFKDFILTAEKDRLEAMLKDNPKYYYDILPFAQVLGVSNIWADKFKDITMEPPSWYYGYHGYFNLWLLNSSLHSFSSAASQTMFSPPQSTGSASFGGGGGFSGGGGFIGGGFGGGGGGSW